MEFKAGDLVRARHRMGKGVEGHLAPGDIGLVEEIFYKPPHPIPLSGQLYRISWLPTTASGVWWMRDENILPLDGMDNAV